MEILWLGLAYVLGMFLQALRLPPLVGYLAAGLALYAFGVEGGEVLHEIGHLGVLLLLFTVGLHLRVKSIFRPEVLGGGGLHMIISSAIFMGIASLFGFGMMEALIIGILLSFSSTVIAAKALESKGELGAFHARVSIGILILQDLVAITILAITGGGAPSVWSFGLLVLPLIRPLLLRLLVASGHDELQLLYGLILAVGLGTLFGELGLSSELGALVAGALISGHDQADELGKKLWGLKEAFLVGFFLEVGLKGWPDLQDLVFAGALLLALPLKSLLFFFVLIAFKLRSRNSFSVTTTLTSFSEFTLIAGTVAAASGFIPESMVIVFAILTSVSYALNAPLTSNRDLLWDRYEFQLIPFERNVKHPGQSVVSLGGAQYLIVGMGQAGAAAYDYLKGREFRVTGMDIDPARIERNLKAKRRVVYGDIRDPELWQNLDLSGVESVMMATSNTEAKVDATKLLRKNGFSKDIYALTMLEDEQKLLTDAGANSVCLPMRQAGQKLAELSISSEYKGSKSLVIDYAASATNQ